VRHLARSQAAAPLSQVVLRPGIYRVVAGYAGLMRSKTIRAGKAATQATVHGLAAGELREMPWTAAARSPRPLPKLGQAIAIPENANVGQVAKRKTKVFTLIRAYGQRHGFDRAGQWRGLRLR
jgi:hypothetical protein